MFEVRKEAEERGTSMNLFDILGPVMVGPSSSHTAGAVRIGLAARRLLGEGTPKSAEITLFGSFAATGRGHGTDRALIAGLLGYKPDDERIADSYAWAKGYGMDVHFEFSKRAAEHPNTATIKMTRLLEVSTSVPLCCGHIASYSASAVPASSTADRASAAARRHPRFFRMTVSLSPVIPRTSGAFAPAQRLHLSFRFSITQDASLFNENACLPHNFLPLDSRARNL